jgi:hypothetical protein
MKHVKMGFISEQYNSIIYIRQELHVVYDKLTATEGLAR